MNLIPRKVLFGNPDVTQVRLSRDGRYLSYLAPSRGYLNIWVAPSNSPDDAKVLTDDQTRGVRNHIWAYDDTHVLYLQDKVGDENWHVFATNIESGKTKDLTPFDDVQANIVDAHYYHPDRIVVSLNKRDPHYHDLYLLEISSGELELLQENRQAYASFLVDSDYQVRFASKFTEHGSVDYFIKENDEFKHWLSIPAEDTLTTGALGLNANGKILFWRESRERNTSAVYTWDLETDKKALVAEHDKADVQSVLTHPKTEELEAVVFNYLREEFLFVNPSLKSEFEGLQSIESGDIQVTSRTLEDDKWIIGFLNDDSPINYYLYDRGSQIATFLFSNRSDLAGYSLTRMHTASIRAKDGLELPSYLSLPKNVEGRRPQSPLPMVLLVHGGPWARDSWGFNPYHQLFADRGYAILSVNFRGSTGFGKDHLNLGNLEWAGKMQGDLIDAVRWAIEEGIAAREHIAIMGGSYGGYATLVGLTFTPDTFACGIDIVGPSNLNTLLATIPPYWASGRQVFLDRMGNPDTENGRQLLEDRSPINFVDRIKRPLLIAHGANDPRVKQSESDRIVKVMKEKDIPVIYALYPDEGHGFARPQNSLSFIAITEAFLQKCLGGDSEDVGQDFEGSTVEIREGLEELPQFKKAFSRKS